VTRHLALGVTLCATALLAVAPADAKVRDVGGRLTATGGLTVTWAGDPAQGCAATGLCGYKGSADLSAEGSSGDFYLAIDDGRIVSDQSSVDPPTDPPVRVTRTEGGVEKGTCSDHADVPSLYLFSKKANSGRAKFKVQSPDLSSARCGGPTSLARAIARLPAREVSLKRVAKGDITLDFSGSVPYTLGSFSGTVTSTVKFHLGKAHANPYGTPSGRRSAGPRAAKPALVRIVHLKAKYRVAGYTGKLSASFGGLTAPPCAELDSCGVTGSTQWVIRASGGVVQVDGDARVGRSAHGVRDALAAIRRRDAAVYSYGDIDYVEGTTTADLTRPGGVACHDTARNASPGIAVINARTPRIVVAGEDAFSVPADDVLRAGCPGPRQRDIFGDRSFAKGPLRLRWLGRRRIDVSLAGSGQFSGPGYSGSRTARFRLELRRVSIRASYRRTRYPNI
jgi:hypothetical protein